MAGTTAQQDAFAVRVVVPVTALTMLAVQVGSNATRDALFLSFFSVTTLPWFVALGAFVTFLAAPGAGSLLARYGPGRTAPATFALSSALFCAEAWLLEPLPAPAAVVLYFHATVLGAIATSTFWSLLNERFDPYSAKALFPRVANAATLGAVFGGVGAERVAAIRSPGVLLVVLAAGAAMCSCGTLAVARGGHRPAGRDERLTSGADRSAPDRTSYVRELAVIAALAALVGTLCDYLLKAEVAVRVASGAPLVRFFGLFYAATGIAAFAVQATLAGTVLGRLRIAGALAVHPLAVGVAGLASLTVPFPWRGILPRCADATVRRSLFRTGYELLYTPLSDATRRSVKTTIDVGWDCAGNFAGAAVVFLMTRLMPAYDIAAITIACIVGAGAELLSTRRLRSGHLTAVEESLRRQGARLSRVTHYVFSPVTVAHPASGDNDRADSEGGSAGSAGTPRRDPVVEAFSDLRSSDVGRMRRALRLAATEPTLVSAAIPLLARADLVDEVGAALRAQGARVAGQLADAMADPSTPEIVRRRLPLVLESCVSRRACEGLIEGLSDDSFTVRHRCCRALLQMTTDNALLRVPKRVACAAAERELDAGAGDARSMAHVFDLLALAFDRGMIAFARRACETGDARARGTALVYLETTLPRALFAKLEQRMAPPLPHGR